MNDRMGSIINHHSPMGGARAAAVREAGIDFYFTLISIFTIYLQ